MRYRRGMSIRILAHHAHVFPESVKADGTVQRLLKLMDECGIAEAVCFAPFASQVRELGIDQNSWLVKAIGGTGRLYGFGTVDLSREDVKDQVRRIAELELKGIKLHPNIQQFDVVGERAMEIYAAAEEHRLFLTFHTGVHHYRLKHYSVLAFDEIAWNFPRLHFSMEHIGGYHFFSEALAVIFNNIPFPPRPDLPPRVYGGLVSVFQRDYLPFWYMPPERMIEAIRQVGAERLIFGMDFPYNMEENVKMGLKAVEALPLDAKQRELILGGNLRRELGLI
jgi:predicted TIM-barrel fold metal-dependent hydrolase